MKLIPKHTSGSPIKALKLSPKDVRNLNKATSVEGYGDKVITDEYGNFIPASEIYKYGIVNSSGDMEGFIPEILVSPKYSITKEDLKPKLYSGNIANHPDAKYMSNAYLDAQIQKAKNTEEADKKAGEVNPLTMLNLASAGMSNYMSPTQVVRLGYDVVTGKGKDYLKGKFFEGNNGIVSDNFAKEHPLWSMAINGIGDVAIPLAPFAIKNIPKGYKMAKTKFNNYKLAKQMNKALESPNLSFDFRINRPEKFSMYSSNNFDNEILQNIIDTDPKDLIQWRELTHKPLKTVTLKGPSFGPNGRTFKIWHPENWEWIQNQRMDFGARDRLYQQADASIQKKLSTKELENLKNLTLDGKFLNTFDSRDDIRNIYQMMYNNKIKLFNKLRHTGYSAEHIIPNKTILKSADSTGNAATYVSGIFEHGDDERMLFRPNTRVHEVSHSEYIPTSPINLYIRGNARIINSFKRLFNKGIKGNKFEYLFKDLNGTESSVRASQLKNAFGLTDDEPLTMEMFDYMSKNYVKLFPDANNNMTDWFKVISYLTPNNKRRFLNWLNKHSLAITGATIGGAAAVTDNKK